MVHKCNCSDLRISIQQERPRLSKNFDQKSEVKREEKEEDTKKKEREGKEKDEKEGEEKNISTLMKSNKNLASEVINFRQKVVRNVERRVDFF